MLVGGLLTDQYFLLHNDPVRQIDELVTQIGGADYPLDAVLARRTHLNVVMSEWTREQQKL